MYSIFKELIKQGFFSHFQDNGSEWTLTHEDTHKEHKVNYVRKDDHFIMDRSGMVCFYPVKKSENDN